MKLIDPTEIKKPQQELRFPVTLPSRGKHGYPGVLYCRPLKVGDVKSLVVSDVVNEVTYVKNLIKVLANTVLEPEDFDITYLTWNDFLKLIVAHRVNSLGSVVDLRYECPTCGVQVVSFDLVKDINEVPLPDDYPGDPFEVDGFKFRYPRLSVFWKLDSEFLDTLTDIDLVKDAVAQDFNLDDLPYSTYTKVVEIINKYSAYGLQRDLPVKCSKCGVEQVISIPFFLLLVKGGLV